MKLTDFQFPAEFVRVNDGGRPIVRLICKEDPLLAPNEYRLSGQHIEVEYLPTGAGGAPFVSYQDPTRSLSFRGKDQMEVVETAAGQLVSVIIVLTIDVGDTTFSFLIPRVNLEEGQKSAPVRTVGITTIHRTSLAPGLGHGQTDSYTTVRLVGTATNGIIPLET